ncbi:MAG TPA: NADPH-dependent FMN reductase, partial [Devosia sp.]|nr:NADPH-dependent FMN reductase [Devosia sp.]
MKIEETTLTGETDPRIGSPTPRLQESEFKRRFKSQFSDPAFSTIEVAMDAMAAAAWDAYAHSRKSPHTQKAGSGYADPDYDLAVDWIAAKAAVDAAQQRHDQRELTPRVLLINGSSRSEHTCPGEVSKSFRLMEIAQEVIEHAGLAVDPLDLSRLTSEYGRNIHPCKA